MKNIQSFEKLVSAIVDEPIRFELLENQSAKKWWDKRYVKAQEFTPSTTYGVIIDGVIDFDFKTTTDLDGILKSFISQYTSKRKASDYVDGQMVTLSKKQLLDRIVQKNSDRVHFGLFYTTLYGIGLWDFFNSQLSHRILTDTLSKFLLDNGVKFSNEYSDAMWVYRFKFNTHIEQTNELLRKFKSISE